MSDITISKAEEAKWRERWLELQRTRNEYDYDVAEFAQEVRSVFPRGGAGDAQFMLFARKEFRPARSDVLLQKAIAIKDFPRESWIRFGGWQSISFLAALTTAQRRHLLMVLKDKKGRMQYWTIREIARSLGIQSQRQRRGDRAITEHKNTVVSSWLLNLYRSRTDLPPLPPEVVQALNSRTRAQIESLAGARA